MGAGAIGPRRALDDSLAGASFPMLARLGRGSIVGAIGTAGGDAGARVLAVRRLEPDGALSPWLHLGSGVRSGAVAGHGMHGAWAAWAERDEDRTRVRLARLARR
jgi:hypothetical protein